jgi:hypothetical protein
MSGRPRTVVREYGRDALLFAWNPLAAAVMSSIGMRVGARSERQVIELMEKDALDMLGRGYRVVDTQEVRVPVVLRPGTTTSYYRVTYERTDGPVAGRSSVG